MSKHTPGPFEVKKESSDGDYYLRCKAPRKGDGFIVERIIAQGIRKKDDANLLRAAPDLLEALEEIISSYSPHKGIWIDSVEKARAAIARAKGEK